MSLRSKNPRYRTRTGTFAASFATAATEVAGTADAMSFGVSSVGSSGNSVTATLNNIETINLTATGTATNYISFDSTAAITVNVLGAGIVDIGAVGTGLTVFNAAASTGSVTADLTNAAAGALKTVTGGRPSKDDGQVAGYDKGRPP